MMKKTHGIQYETHAQFRAFFFLKGNTVTLMNPLFPISESPPHQCGGGPRPSRTTTGVTLMQPMKQCCPKSVCMPYTIGYPYSPVLHVKTNRGRVYMNFMTPRIHYARCIASVHRPDKETPFPLLHTSLQHLLDGKDDILSYRAPSIFFCHGEFIHTYCGSYLLVQNSPDPIFFSFWFRHVHVTSMGHVANA